MRVDSLTGDTYLKSIWDPPKQVETVKVEGEGEEEEMEEMEEEEEVVGYNGIIVIFFNFLVFD